MALAVFALLSAIFAALVAIFGKVGLQSVDSSTATAVRAIVMAVVLVLVIVAEGKMLKVGAIVSDWNVFKFILASGIAGALSWLFYFMALKIGKVSQVVPIDRLSIVFALILGVLVLGEKADWKTALGSVLVVVGAILVALS